MMHLAALLIGVLLDALFGDPHGFPHIVVLMGRLIASGERLLRRLFPATPHSELWAGLMLAICLPTGFCAATWGLLYLAGQINVWLALVLESLICWQCLALRSLRDESEAVRRVLVQDGLPAARRAVSRIVGRDTSDLDAAGVTRATVETVAENTSDGVIAPLLFLAFGAPFGVLYKAINTLDSMVGYKSDRYLYFGRVSARLDDAVNFLPARIAGLLMVLAAGISGLDRKNAWRIFRRDRRNHASPNSAQTEAACAGALHVRLGGDARYFGKLVQKPTIGDADRPVEPEDIRRAQRLMIVSSSICLMLVILGKVLVIWL